MAPTDLKYELTTDGALEMPWGLAFRVRALRAIPEHEVRAGDLGGFVGGDHNLAHDGAAWIASGALATGQARVEGDALAEKHSHLNGDARLSGAAVVTGGVHLSGRAIVTERARIEAGTSITDRVLVAGDVTIRHRLHLSGDVAYRRQEDVPWSLRTAKPTEPGYDERAREAVEIDPAFHRAFAALGAQNREAREAALTELLAEHAGREAFAKIARSIGGIFHPHAYHPRSPADLTYDQAYEVRGHAALAQATNFRVLRSIDAKAHDLGQKGRPHAAVIEANLYDPASGSRRLLYQAAIFNDVEPERPTLSPIGGRLSIHPDAFETWLQATHRSEVLVRDAANMPPTLNPSGAPFGSAVPVSISLDHLPLLLSGREVEREELVAPSLARLALQHVGPSLSRSARPGLHEPKGYAVIEVGRVYTEARPDGPLDLSDVAQGLPFHNKPEQALHHIEPIYAGRADVLTRLAAEVGRHESRIGGVRETAPTATPVLVQILDSATRAAEPPTDHGVLSYGVLRAALPPLDWRSVRDPRDPFQTRTLDDVFEADSLNARFSVAKDGSTWTLHVENPRADPVRDRPLHRQDGLPDSEAAFDAAHSYRAKLIAAELGLPSDDLVNMRERTLTASDAATIEIPAVFEVRETKGSDYLAGVLSLEHGRLTARTNPTQHPTQDQAAKAAMAQLRQAAPQPTTILDLPKPASPQRLTAVLGL